MHNHARADLDHKPEGAFADHLQERSGRSIRRACDDHRLEEVICCAADATAPVRSRGRKPRARRGRAWLVKGRVLGRPPCFSRSWCRLGHTHDPVAVALAARPQLLGPATQEGCKPTFSKWTDPATIISQVPRNCCHATPFSPTVKRTVRIHSGRRPWAERVFAFSRTWRFAPWSAPRLRYRPIPAFPSRTLNPELHAAIAAPAAALAALPPICRSRSPSFPPPPAPAWSPPAVAPSSQARRSPSSGLLAPAADRQRLLSLPCR